MEPEGLRRLNIRSLNRRHIDALENFVERYDLEVNVGRLKTTDFLLKLWKQEEMKKRKGERYRRKMLKDAENLIMSMNTLKHGELIGAEEMRRRGREQSGEGMRGVSGLSEGLAKKLNPACPYRLLEDRFDAVRALKGMDQKTPYHSLTADMHTREVLKHFGKSREFASLSRKEKGWAILATHLHDVGKGHPDGQQKKDGRVQYVGHNVVSARLAADILPGFDISEDGKRFVLAMVRYHDATLKIMDAFAGNNQPKGGQLGAYDTYTSNIEEMPKSETRAGLLKNMALMLAFTRADVAATVSS